MSETIADQVREYFKRFPNLTFEQVEGFIPGLTIENFRMIKSRLKLKKLIEWQNLEIRRLEDYLRQVDLIARDYVTKKGVLQYDKRYYKLQNNTIWFLGLNIRERIDKLKGILPLDANMREYSFHHEDSYRKHWHALFTNGEFVKNHKQGSMSKS